MSTPATTRGLALAAGTALISGVAVFVNSYGVRAFPDATVYTTAKNVVAAAVLAGLAAAMAGRSEKAGPVRGRRLFALLGVAVIGGSVPFVLFFEGLARASSTHAAFVHKSLIIWVALLAPLVLREVLRPVHVAAIVLLLGGQLLLDGGLAGFRLGTGELLILGATLLWSAEVLLVKRLLKGVPVPTLAVARMGLGAALLVGWLAITGRLGELGALGWTGWGWAVLTGGILAAYVGTWYAALALAPAVDVTAVLVLAAPITAALSLVATGTVPATGALLGCLLILLGAGVVLAGRRAPVRAEP